MSAKPAPDYAAMDAADGCAPGYSKMAAERDAAVKFLTNWRVNKCTPFSDGDDILRQAHGLVTVLEHAHLDADDMGRRRGDGDGSLMHNANAIFMAQALNAVGSLVSLAILLGEAT
jgi:hypothetical protein